MSRAPAAWVVAALLVLPAGAGAAERSSGEVRALAERAGSDAAALAALRATDVVDGRPADLGAALEGARGELLARRLAALARGSGGASGSRGTSGGSGAAGGSTGAADAAAAARARAASILREDRFRVQDGARPRRSLGERIGDWLGDRLDGVPGPPALALTILGGLVLLGAAWLTSRVTSRLALADPERAGAGRARAADPAALERDAVAAEASGDFARAVRLRFAAGLLRLDAARAIRLQPSLTTGQVRRALASERFDALATTFDAVAYGDRPAQAADAAAAREAWPAVLRDARPHEDAGGGDAAWPPVLVEATR